MQNDDLKNTILFLFDEINKTEYLEGATKYNTLKIFYELKKELPEEHPLKEYFAFYWYLHGPFSEHIVAKIEKMVGKYLTKEPQPHKKYDLYKIKSDIKVKLYNPELIDDEVRKIIGKLLQRKIFFNIEKIVYEDAPYPFMSLYKTDFLKIIKNYNYSVLNGNENQNLLEEAVTKCYKCEGKLPFESYYSTYEDLFSEYLTSLDKLYRNEMMPNYLYDVYKKSMINKTNGPPIYIETWNTFGYGVRVKKHEPHPDYENRKKLDNWDHIYKGHLEEFDSNVKKFSKFARENSRARKVDFSETSKKILSSTLGTYLTCDNNGQI